MRQTRRDERKRDRKSRHERVARGIERLAELGESLRARGTRVAGGLVTFAVVSALFCGISVLGGKTKRNLRHS